MKASLEKFFEKLLTDLEFKAKFVSTNSAQEGYEAAKEFLEDVTFEEFKEAISKIYQGGGVLNLDEETLANISGGLWKTVVTGLTWDQ